MFSQTDGSCALSVLRKEAQHVCKHRVVVYNTYDLYIQENSELSRDGKTLGHMCQAL